MMTLVIYDIPKDRLRQQVADICLDYGLERIQYSAFLGELSRNHREELIQKVQRRVGKQPANVQLFLFNDREANLRRQVVTGTGA